MAVMLVHADGRVGGRNGEANKRVYDSTNARKHSSEH